jgi:RNA-directed DNA polymerase
LGFTHYCGRSRAGRFKLKRKTSKKKYRAKIADMKSWFRSQLMPGLDLNGRKTPPNS